MRFVTYGVCETVLLIFLSASVTISFSEYVTERSPLIPDEERFPLQECARARIKGWPVREGNANPERVTGDWARCTCQIKVANWRPWKRV